MRASPDLTAPDGDSSGLGQALPRADSALPTRDSFFGRGFDLRKGASQRLWVWQYRQLFLQTAQRKVPAIGAYLRRYGMRCEPNDSRRKVIGQWQQHFHLPNAWAAHCAWITLAMWDHSAELRHSLQWFASPPGHNLAETGIATFTFPAIKRAFPEDLDFALFKQSIHGALEAALDRFGHRIGAADREGRRQPKNLIRAFECLALRVCKMLRPQDITARPEYARDWTTLSRDIQSAAKLIGLQPPGRGRPARKHAS